MNRTIKFRGKNTINGNFVEGYFLVDKGHYNIHTDHTVYPIHPHTVGQFTGLTDKNGIEIYEGDILDFDEREWGCRFIPEVVKMENLIGKWDMAGSLSDLTSWRQVIGNIYENPELC